MTTPTRDAHRRRWVAASLVAVLAVALGLFAAAPASAASIPAAQNAVGAPSPAGQVVVGPSTGITAGQRPGNDPPRAQVVVATGVAAETAETVAVNGETAATALGRQMHATWDYGPGFSREFTLKAGGRVDGINFGTREVIDLKPNNPRAIRLGNQQLEGYIAKLNVQFPGKPWTGRVVTYDR